MKIKFTHDENELINFQIQCFLDGMKSKNQSVDFYEKKRGAPRTRAEINILMGKKAEFFVAKALGISFDRIDLEIRNGRGKGWKVDLEPNIHVKSCDNYTVSIAKDKSWIWENIDPMRLSDEYDHDLVALVYAENWYDSIGNIMAMYEWGEIKECLRLTKARKFWSSKKCIYYNDIAQLGFKYEIRT